MKKMQKVIAAVLAVVFVGSAFAACSNGSTDTDTNAKIASYEDLKGKKIGVQLGTTGDIYVSDDEDLSAAGTEVEQFKSGYEAVQALKSGKIDAVVIDNEPAKAFVESDKSGELKILDEAFADEQYALCFSKSADKQELNTKINNALKELVADGTVEKILNNYIGDNKGSYQYTSPANVQRTNGELVMATNAQFPPYEYKDGDKIVGIDADIAQAIADKLGMTLKIEDMAFDSIITAVTTGKADFGAAGMTITEERKQSVNFSDTYVTAKQVIIVKA